MATLDDFLSFLQGASNSAASTVTAPVDAINWALGKAGLPVSKKPVGGSDWLKELGFMAEPKNKNAGLLGEAIGGVLPMVAAAKAPQIAAGLNQAGRNLAAPRTLNPQTGAIVWHGSPHKFDKFDSSKIGTGEGAQAYGHGLYLAENPSVAREYQEKLSSTGGAKNLAKQYGGIDKGIAEAQRRIAHYKQLISEGGGGDLRRANGMLNIAQKSLEDLSAMKAGLPENTGALYKVDLPDEHIAKMLDWDKPLSQQHPDVQSVIRNIAPTAKPYDIPIDHDPTGAQFYGMFSAPTEIGQRGASQAFKDAGIPGIRYLDGGSRTGGAGTSNFVVFPGNEGLLSILERNGQALK